MVNGDENSAIEKGFSNCDNLFMGSLDAVVVKRLRCVVVTPASYFEVPGYTLGPKTGSADCGVS
jgi:hypothetical protein